MAVYGGFCAWVIIQDAVFNVCHIVISENHAKSAHADFACLQIHLAVGMGGYFLVHAISSFLGGL